MVRSRLIALLVLFIGLVQGYKTYEGYKVVKVIPETEDQVKALHKLNTVLGFEVDFWKESRRVGRWADIMVAPHQVAVLLAALRSYGFNPKIAVDNVATLVHHSMAEINQKRAVWIGDDPNQFPLNQYHTFADMMTYLDAVATTYDQFVTIGTIGTSLQGRVIKYVKIGTPQPGVTKPALMIDAGIHAREWIAPATAIWTIQNLVQNYTTKYKALLDAIDIIIAPSINPDGYEYSRTNDRMWRKTRSGPISGCFGADPNRNYPYFYGYDGTSLSPCSDIFQGQSALSEVECAAHAVWLNNSASYAKAYLTIHSYGEDMIYPWGYKVNTYPPDVAELRALGLQAAAAIQSVHGTQYVVDNSADALYPAAGASDDYGKSVGIKYVYTMELRPGDGDTDDDQYGFQLPEQFIIVTAEETFAGIMVVANQVMTGP